MITQEFFRTLIRSIYALMPLVAFQPELTTRFDSEYDYVIVGGGSAGSVLANRLSEDPCVKVLLLEAGGPVDLISELPAVSFLVHQTENDWNYKSTPQKNAGEGYPNRQILIPRGKGLGGSTVLHCHLYIRGNKRDYDQWAADGATGWSWKEVYPYFLKSENNTDPEISRNGYHATGGYLTVETPNNPNALKDAFAAAAPELGYKYRDINGEVQTGFAKVQGTIRDGRRLSTAKAYLVPAQDRKNLHIVNEAFVQKILINDNKEAHGVRFEKDGQVHDIHANKEVILSAGSISSPQILMLSGVGPKEHLEQLGIPVVADLPVGDNLQDHPGTVALNFEADQPTTQVLSDKAASPANIERYEKDQSGPGTSLAGIEGLAFLNTKYNDPSQEWPDVEIHLLSGSPATDGTGTFKKGFAITDEVYNKVYEPYIGKNTFTFFPVILRPESRGTLRLRSADPHDYPLVDFNVFDKETDLDKVVDVMKICINIVSNTTAFKKIGAKMFTIPHPACEQHPIYSDDYLRCVAKAYFYNVFHPAGTVKMGSLTDNTAVVDPELKVKGIKNLRVIDNSVMPKLSSGNTNAPTIMIAEKGSDMIKNENADREHCAA